MDLRPFAQQIVVPGIGAEGQRKISAARVLVIGAGGLGTPVATYLGAAGVGQLTIMDGDTVAISNLSRQFHFHSDEVGRSKALILADRIKAQQVGIDVRAVDRMMDADNANSVISEHDIVCDCTDNAEARILVNDTCRTLGKPISYAVVRGWEGYVTVLHHEQRIDLSDIFPYADLRAGSQDDCATAGIVNTTCGIAGNLQATEVLKIILDMPSRLDGGILCFDASIPTFRIFDLQRSGKK